MLPLGALGAHHGEEAGGPCAQGLCLFQSSSFSSITDSTMSLNIITVTLNMGECGTSTPQHLPHATPWAYASI